MGPAGVIGAIAFDPNIRGILVVLTGVVVLMGSIFMLLATNTGARVGFMLAAAGLCGWMVILGLLWTINTGGLRGRDAAWMPAEINYNRSAPGGAVVPVATPELALLRPPSDLPAAPGILARFPLLRVMVLGSEGADYVPKTLTQLKTAVSPLVYADAGDVADVSVKARENVPELIAEDPQVSSLLDAGGETLAEQVRADAISLRSEIDGLFGDWCLISESDPRRGNAVSSADAELAREKVFGETTSSADYIVGDVWFFGGREPCTTLEERSDATRVWDRIRTIFIPKQPELLSAVTLVKATPVVTKAGETPPSPTPQAGASTVTVVQRWNYGNVRLIPFVFFLGNLILFSIFASLLHFRDKAAMAQRDEWTGSSA